MDTKGLPDLLRDRIALLVDTQPDSVHDDTPLRELGLDSLMLLELVALIEQHVGFELPESDLPGLTSIRRVQEYVSHLSSP